MFQKKMIVAAVAGALGAGATGAAFAQTTVGNTEIYGRLYPEFTVLSGSGATAAGTTGLSTLARTPTGNNLKSRNSVDASNSRLGFRGTESLGSGLSAIWQIESTVPLDAGGGILATRESFVGLKGGFGTVRLGFMDTVYKELGDPIRFMGVASGNHVSVSNIISSRMPFGGSGGSFHLRQPNGLWYETPNMNGVTLLGQYSPDTQESAPANAATKKEFWSLGARYKSGPIYVALAHEIHKDFFGGSTSAPSALSNLANTSAHSNDTSTRLTGMWNFSADGRVALDVAKFNFSESGGLAGRFESYKNNRWGVTWEQRWGGPWRTAAMYANSSAGSCGLFGGAVCSTSGLNGNMMALGAEYSFSKRTALFALYSRLNNGQSASYRNAENVNPYDTGADVTQYSLGIRHDY